LILRQKALKRRSACQASHDLLLELDADRLLEHLARGVHLCVDEGLMSETGTVRAVFRSSCTWSLIGRVLDGVRIGVHGRFALWWSFQEILPVHIMLLSVVSMP
jgi:hypothetical protein